MTADTTNTADIASATNTPQSATTPYRDMTPQQLQDELLALQDRHEAFKARGLKLNMARGKPAPEQLDLSLSLLDTLPASAAPAQLNTTPATVADDLRNYGALTGIPEAKQLMGAIMDVPAANVIVGGNSSLELMYNTVSAAMTHGIMGSTPWAKLDEPVKFLCPVPGYDRHFAICEHFGIKMIPVPLYAQGPDMYVVERYVNTDPLVKGIWCVPRFSNPTGATYAPKTLERLASLYPAAEDFRIYWDNAYAVHEFAASAPSAAPGLPSAIPGGSACADGAHPVFDTETQNSADGEANSKSMYAKNPGAPVNSNPALLSIKTVCEQSNNPHIWYQFASTSKITFAGGGIAALASSQANLESITRQMGFRTIGYDKLNQKRHALFLRDLDGVRAHMAKHAAILAPKFACVLDALEHGLGACKVGEWTRPEGGYFISFMGPPNTAKRTVQLASEVGVTLTPAGATYPNGNDPYDSNIRIAPTYPSLEDLRLASELFVICVRIAALEQLLAKAR
jgi:DNA-binding transcriptional MocR family regulator